MEINKSLFIFLILLSPSIWARDSYQWTDDKGRSFTVYHDPYSVAVFKNDMMPPVKDWKLQMKGAKIEVYHSSSPIFVKEKGKSESRAKSLNYITPKGTLYSPVFSDSESGEAQKVLVGGIIVYFPMEKSEKDIMAFFNQKKLIPIKKLPYVKKNAYLVESKAGFEALELANKLKEENPKELIAAYPDWAQSFVIKDLKSLPASSLKLKKN